jgi:hypothetical protein
VAIEHTRRGVSLNAETTRESPQIDRGQSSGHEDPDPRELSFSTRPTTTGEESSGRSERPVLTHLRLARFRPDRHRSQVRTGLERRRIPPDDRAAAPGRRGDRPDARPDPGRGQDNVCLALRADDRASRRPSARSPRHLRTPQHWDEVPHRPIQRPSKLTNCRPAPTAGVLSPAQTQRSR